CPTVAASMPRNSSVRGRVWHTMGAATTRTQIFTTLRAVALGTVFGLAVTSVGVYVYAFLGAANVQHAPEIPWSAVVAAGLLWVYWLWLGGWGPPRRTSAYRERMRRANSIPRNSRWQVLAAGLAGFLFAGSAMTLGFRLSDLPENAIRAPAM